jgi:enoyl-CoA hydratase/carnithine racemase
MQVPGPSMGWGLDGGLSFLLPRLKGGSMPLARYLALTGSPLSGEDMIASGLSTHHMAGGMVPRLHHSFADMQYEDDGLVEDAVADHAEVYYKIDWALNPMPYKGLFAKWAKNDEEREK